MRGKLGQGVGALKKEGLEPPYDLWLGFLMTTSYFFAYTQWAGNFTFLQHEHENRSFFLSDFQLYHYSDF